MGLELSINKDAVGHNLKVLCKNCEALCMVKADGYGLGMETVVPLLLELGITYFGVAFLEEARALRSIAGNARIFILNISSSEASDAAEMGFEVAVDSLDVIEAIDSACKVHLHLNTGMNRLGCSREEFPKLLKAIECNKYLTLEGVMTHLPCSGDPKKDDLTKMQLDLFHELTQGLSCYLHAANSDAARRFLTGRCNLVRLGLGLFSGPAPLKNALTLSSSIIKIHEVKIGDGVSYGHKFIAKRDSKIAVVSIGYADGLPFKASGKINVLINGTLAPQVGAIAMDFIMIDITDCNEAIVGSKVTLFDEKLTLLEQSKRGRFLPYELLTNLSSRVSRSIDLECVNAINRH